MSGMNGSTSASSPAARYASLTSSTSRAPVWCSTRIGCPARRGAASTIATLIACAPWEPPKTSNCNGPSGSRAGSSGNGSKNSGRTGLPLTNAFAPKKRCVESKVTAAAFTIGASSRLVSPGTAFCSSIIVGTADSAATSTTGPELYPPTPITRSG